MTRSEARRLLVDCIQCDETVEGKADTILVHLDSALHFDPEIAEMSAVCRGVARINNGE